MPEAVGAARESCSEATVVALCQPLSLEKDAPQVWAAGEFVNCARIVGDELGATEHCAARVGQVLSCLQRRLVGCFVEVLSKFVAVRPPITS